MERPKYTVIKDTRERMGWTFAPNDSCEGTIIETLKTGDYSLKGFEHLFTIERKGTTAEIAQNITQQRFANELERLQEFDLSFLLLEFNMNDLLLFPGGSTVPLKKMGMLKVTGPFLLKRMIEYEINYKTKIIFAGGRGKEVASSIFKRIVEKYG